MNMQIRDLIKPEMKGVFYGRHSTVHQDIEAQWASMKYFADQYGCHIVKEYFDRGVSARKKSLDHRKYMHQLLSDAPEGLFDYVVVYSSDRLARDPYEHCIIRMKMKELGIPIFLSYNDTIYDTGDILIQTVRDGVSKYELEKIRTNTRNAYYTRVRKSHWVGGNAPFGYHYDPDTGEISDVPTEQIYVKQVFDMYKNGDGFSSIAKKMPAESYRGSNWEKHKVRRLITNPFYAGYFSIYRTNELNKNCINANQDDWIMVYSEQINPVITKEEWDYSWNLYTKKRSSKVEPHFYKRCNRLNNLIYCVNCPSSWVVYNQKSKNKKTGASYGNIYYKCKHCGRRFEKERMENIIPFIWGEMHSMGIDELYKEHANQVNHLMEEIQKNLAVLLHEKNKLEQAITQFKKAIMNRYGNQQDEVFLKTLQMASLNAEKKMPHIVTQIEKWEQAENYLENIEGNRLLFERLHEEIKKDYRLIDKTKVRMMLLRMVQRITIEKDNRATITILSTVERKFVL
jgi:site-specific DNA recombinase